MNEPRCAAHIAWDDALTGYDFGRGHPMSPVRLDLTIRLARAMGVLDRPDVRVVAPKMADDAALTSVHTAEYVAAVRAAGADPATVDLEHGLGTDDDPCFTGMHEASAGIVGGTVEAARAVWDGRALHGVNVAGGLHHAMADHAAGFCVYNDVAVGIRALLDAGAERVAYVDVDVHHGDGVQAAFYDDPRVLTVSLHESPRTLFPGTGTPNETGAPSAEGSAVNVALPPGTNDVGWLRAFHAVVPPLLRSWKPQILVTQHGCDGHLDDPLAHLALTVDGQRASYVALHELAHELCDGRWVATGGGGYAVLDVVPRAWTHLLAIAAEAPIAPETDIPQSWRDHVGAVYGRGAQLRMTDGAAPEATDWNDGYDPAEWLDQAVLATRNAVFPLHGLDPGH
ncbi:acetoin utilization protein AcuC [Haloactinopolyspora alba]|uniref:Acetoin utilization protein AcuC n=1 Tax=Haloactinopolyspora alba TaxID=648780 RepID=A0A2P8DJX0_9ACTN|nr:acetoin utilization protein AcuC [Haloactinopolyspora alba]PSK97517.1 acetoin utilization protein AcuC [Haloactinopolyspora alba]